MPRKEKGYTLGHRFDAEINDRVDSVLQIYEATLEPDSADSEAEAKAKLLKKQKLINYRSVVNPEKTYNLRRKSAEIHHARGLTIEALDGLLDATGWTSEFFWEMCLAENRHFSPQQCYDHRNTAGWTRLKWPDDTMRRMAAVLDRSSDEYIIIVEKSIKALLPASYPVFLEKLNEPSLEFGNSRGESGNAVSGGGTETKLQNMGDRIYESIRYRAGDDKDAAAACAESGIAYDQDMRARIYRPCHFWVFNPRELGRISRAFSLSPHWVVYGNGTQTLLAEKPGTERLMDMFQFLPSEAQTFILNAFSGGKGEIL